MFQLIGTFQTGIVYAFVALGAYLTFEVLDFPDLTVEGSFPLGAAVAAALMVGAGVNPWIATAAGFVAGGIAGWMTAYLNVRFGILHILAGILVGIGLYSVNLRIMGGPNIPLIGTTTVFSIVENIGATDQLGVLGVLLLLLVVLTISTILFLYTRLGISLRAAGSNPVMAEANGINVGRVRILGVCLANALTALGGALFAQMFGAADAAMGNGIIIIALASVIIGMRLIPSGTPLLACVASVVGALIYGMAVTLALSAGAIGLHAGDIQLVTAVVVAVALIAGHRRDKIKRGWNVMVQRLLRRG